MIYYLNRKCNSCFHQTACKYREQLLSQMQFISGSNFVNKLEQTKEQKKNILIFYKNASISTVLF